jgi:hypothetical protein
VKSEACKGKKEIFAALQIFATIPVAKRPSRLGGKAGMARSDRGSTARVLFPKRNVATLLIPYSSLRSAAAVDGKPRHAPKARAASAIIATKAPSEASSQRSRNAQTISRAMQLSDV